jgi:hypothetical protein
MPASMGPPDQRLLECDPSDQLLRNVTGRDPVSHGRHVRTDDVLASVERIHLVETGGGILVAFWPAELENQARYLYNEGRAEAMVRAGRAAGWAVEGRPQLAFRNSAPPLRLYLQPVTEPDEVDGYAARWSGPDSQRIGAHSRAALRDKLWPWLERIGYVSHADNAVLRQYLNVLGRRDAFFRAALCFTQRWSAARSDGTLAGEIRAAISAPLVAAGEPALPLP